MKKFERLFGVAASAVLVLAACGGGSDGQSVGSTNESAPASGPSTSAPAIVVGDDASSSPPDSGVPMSNGRGADTEIPAPSGELRIGGGAGVTSFNPAAVNSAQFNYLIPVYDTLTRQNADFEVLPGLATSWTRPDPNTWEFTVRDGVVFHDGTPFDAQVAVDNIEYHSTFEGNPNAITWKNLVSARVVDATTFQVEFDQPVPSFPTRMSLIPGMMINPNFLDGTDLTRNPQGSGPWVHSDGESQAGVTEVYTLNENYWNPADQGVEKISITSFPEDTARMNALITNEIDMSFFVRDDQVQSGLDAGMKIVSVSNYLPFIMITDRAGQIDPALGDPRVREAIALSIDRDTFNDAIHSGRADTSGGIYPPNFSQFYWSEFDDKNDYDPERARDLLAEAGYADGVTIQMPVMPAISAQMDLVVQMLGTSGVTVDLVQINNGELGPRMLSKEFGIAWLRALLEHPSVDLINYSTGTWNVFELDDLAAVDDLVARGDESGDPEAARALYAEATELILDSGAMIPLAHAAQNTMYSPGLSGVTVGLGMQGPPPQGVRIGE